MFKKRSIDDLKVKLTREEIVRRSRILLVDDETPLIIDELKKARFSIDHVTDITKDNINILDRFTYDLIILDYGNVGREFGKFEGLDLLRHIKRVAPSTIVIAYTSKSLNVNQADFYKLTDEVLSKDAGIADTFEIIENCLTKAHSIKNLWKGLITAKGIVPGSSEDIELQNEFVVALSNRSKMKKFKNSIYGDLNDNATKIVFDIILQKIFSVVLPSLLGIL